MRKHVPDFEDEEDDGSCSDWLDNLPEVTRNLVACWPNSLAEIAKHIGITQRELKLFISEKASLSQVARGALVGLLGIAVPDFYNLDDVDYIPFGPFVLIAKNAKELEKTYDDMTYGGDASPFEMIPAQGAADPSWRYVLINPYARSPSILMIPRGDKISESLPKLLLNYRGVDTVSSELYQDVVSTCALACSHPAQNIKAMLAFEKRHELELTPFIL